MIVRTAFLSVPAYDEDAVAALRGLLNETGLRVVTAREEGAGHQRHWVEELLRRWCDEEEIDLIVTIGGTMPAGGLSAQEIVPEATAALLERQLPAFSEAMRHYASQETALAYLDRGTAGIRGRTLIINLPAGAAPAHLFLEAIVDLLEPALLYINEAPSAPQLQDVLQIEKTDGAIDVAQPTDRDTNFLAGLDAQEFAEFLDRRKRSG